MSRKTSTKNQRLILSTEERLRKELIFINNPVLVEGLALAPVIGAAVSARNAAMMALMILTLLIPTRFLGNFLIGFVPQRLRAMICAFMACGCYIPGHILLASLFGVRVASLGIYLPMLVVDSIIITRTEIPQRESIADSFINGIRTSFGFAFAVLLVGAVRELAGLGRIWGIEVLSSPPLPIA
ncbi:MAG: hypothetical protein FWE66_05570, partial [Oscillospiraceae bacterium]|nr:hypothetical protein [Oscillospiraceae bacterium]